MSERWKEIVEANCDYAISSYGRVKRITPTLQGYTYVIGIRKTGLNNRGYAMPLDMVFIMG
jgi:NUMOD4 motif